MTSFDPKKGLDSEFQHHDPNWRTKHETHKRLFQ